MLYRTLTLGICVTFLGNQVLAQSGDGVIARCGASAGRAYFFQDPVVNPTGPSWEDDGISAGVILLIKLGSEWDIQFNDALGTSGYRQDGATVLPLMLNNHKLTIGVFHSNYDDIYTFDPDGQDVLWTALKSGTLVSTRISQVT